MWALLLPLLFSGVFGRSNEKTGVRWVPVRFDVVCEKFEYVEPGVGFVVGDDPRDFVPPTGSPREKWPFRTRDFNYSGVCPLPDHQRLFRAFGHKLRVCV
ncbi:hypothetical protein M3Y99_00212100 [Aphelenchoides fujianensis]|nr:hypothetical protein M3Y99_00212100 [Aphelenchoides fujianensis]